MSPGAPRASMRRARVALGLGLAVAAFFASLLVTGRVFFLKDAQLWFYPSRLALRERLLSFDLPEWQPGLELGAPFLADPGNGVLYPPNLLLLLPAPDCVAVFLIAHLVLAAVGAERLLQSFGVGEGARAFGALGFALGGYLVSMTWSGVYLLSVAWMPLIAWLAARVLRRRRLSDVAFMALALGTQILSGELQGVWLTGWLVLALALAYPRPWREKWRALALLGVAAVLALCLAAPQLIPTLELLPSSRRGAGIDLDQASHWSFHPLRSLELVVPWLFGNPLEHQAYLGYFMDDEGGSLHRDPWLVSPYLGSLSVAFAALALARARPRHRWWVRGVAGVALLALLLAFGRHTPAFRAYFQLVPGANVFRYPAKFFALVAACLPLLAAAGVDGWASERKQSRRLAIVAAALLVAVAVGWLGAPAAAAALSRLRPEIALSAALASVRHALGVELGLLALGLGALFWARRHAPGRAALVAAGCLTLQLFRANGGAYETAEPEVYARPPLGSRILEQTPPGEPARLLHPLPVLEVPGLDSLPGPERARIFGASLLKNTGILHGIGYPDTYSAASSPRQTELWRAVRVAQRRALQLYSVRFVMLSKDEPVPRGLGLVPLENVGEVGGVAYRDEGALPLARPVSSAIASPDEREAIARVLEPAVLGGGAVVLERAEVAPDAAVSGPLGECRLTRPMGDAVDLACQLSHERWVVLNVSHHPNWTATLDGQATEIVRANAIVMAVRVPAGAHQLRFEYSEPGLPFGAAIAGFALLAAAALWISARRSRGTRSGGGSGVEHAD